VEYRETSWYFLIRCGTYGIVNCAAGAFGKGIICNGIVEVGWLEYASADSRIIVLGDLRGGEFFRTDGHPAYFARPGSVVDCGIPDHDLTRQFLRPYQEVQGRSHKLAVIVHDGCLTRERNRQQHELDRMERATDVELPFLWCGAAYRERHAQ
jgi:hypothetical protein